MKTFHLWLRLLPEKFSVCQKNNGWPTRGLPNPLAHTPMLATLLSCFEIQPTFHKRITHNVIMHFRTNRNGNKTHARVRKHLNIWELLSTWKIKELATGRHRFCLYPENLCRHPCPKCLLNKSDNKTSGWQTIINRNYIHILCASQLVSL